MDEETCRLVVDYEGIYAVSETGQLRSRYVSGGRGCLGPWRLLKPAIGPRGYLYATLYLHGKQTTHRIHHLVADAFLPAKGPTDTVVRHLNDNKLDNCVENLARGTYSDNRLDSVRNGTGVRARGTEHGSAKLTEDDVREIRRLYATGEFSYRELGLRFGVNQSAIGKIVSRKTWRHVV